MVRSKAFSNILAAATVLALASISCSLFSGSQGGSEPTATLEAVQAGPTLAATMGAENPSPIPSTPYVPPETPPSQNPESSPAPAEETNICPEDSCIVDGYFLLGRPVGEGGRDTIDHSNRFGMYQKSSGEAHYGVDFLNSTGTPVVAAADGVVVVAGDDLKTNYGPMVNAYGNLVIIKHNLAGFSQPVFTLYAQLSQISVKVDDQVKAGQEIGQVGMSGRVTGSTLHFEVRVGENAYGAVGNPELWLKPLPDENGDLQGALAGRVLDAKGKYLQVSNILLERLGAAGQPAVSQIYLKTYADKRLAGHAPLDENFAVGDLPPGSYKVSFWLQGLQQRVIEIQSGKLTEVTFNLK
jgi:murein DD-endopeptidase MepM/ murein hydrolase activator NlpD